MLDAWINRDDVLKLLDEAESIGDLLNRRRFIQRIHELKEYREPKKPKKHRMNNIDHILPFVREYINRIDKEPELVPYYQRGYYVTCGELTNIIKVSDRTIRRLVKKGVINKYKWHGGNLYNLKELENI